METIPTPYKRFVLFQYDMYYPSGGARDVTGSFDIVEEAKAFIASNYQRDGDDLLDRETGEWIDL